MSLAWWPAVPDAWTWTPAFHAAAVMMGGIPLATIVLTARLRGRRISARSWRLLLGATAILVLTLGWPVGSLAQVSITGRSLQYMLITLAAAPVFLLGTPHWPARGRGLARRILERFVSAPWVGAIMLAGAAWATHGEWVVDEVEATALNQALIRALWFVTGILYWWPLVGPGPERERLPYLPALG